MLAKAETSGFQPKKHNHVLASAVLFEEKFSIDWVVEMTGDKPSHVLISLEDAVRKGWVIKEETGCFRFVDFTKKQALRNAIDRKKKQQLNQKIVDILIRELEENDHKPMALAHYLLSIPNDLNKCRWLMRAGNLYLKQYKTEAALRCYSKILTDLASLKTKEANQLYAEVAIKYSKTSTATGTDFSTFF